LKSFLYPIVFWASIKTQAVCPTVARYRESLMGHSKRGQYQVTWLRIRCDLIPAKNIPWPVTWIETWPVVRRLVGF
jgi:hypothetical protein